MAHSVIITTPMPTWDETVERYGLSEAEQKFVIRLVDRKASRRSEGRAGTDRRIRSASLKSAQTGARKVGPTARKKINRARASA
jgi:hypothetical protein